MITGQMAIYRCLKCGVSFVHPQLTDGELHELYGEAYYKSWGLAGRAGNKAVQRMKTDTFDLRLDLIAEYKCSGNILDVGCATGYFLEAAARRGFQVYGVEISDYSCAIAKRNFGDDRVYQGVLENCPFPEKHFDVIAMSDLLEHVRDPIKALRAARRFLKNDGIIMIMTPDTDALTRRLMRGKWTHYKAEHFFYFNRRSISYLADLAGLAAVYFEAAKKSMNLEYVYTQFKAYPHWLLSPVSGLLHHILPRALRARNFHITMGEMVVILKNK
ncbi:MAG: class I SAM-dependent methyltransferase [Elusimicrobiota bacterium]